VTTDRPGSTGLISTGMDHNQVGASPDDLVAAFPIDPMGDDEDLPLFDGATDLSARVDELLADGFGR
jgi:hypothetical protein